MNCGCVFLGQILFRDLDAALELLELYVPFGAKSIWLQAIFKLKTIAVFLTSLKKEI